ncbi:MAG: cyclase family protein [Thermoguttaceae bacterium]|nr:cyclase family protein [Thermoguttaceae bacterium]
MVKRVDLSRPIVEGMSVYPGDPLFQISAFADHTVDGFRGSKLTLGTHLGTHIDAPFHYFVDGETLDMFPVDFFFGQGVVIDVTSLVGVNSERFASRASGRPAALNVADLEPFASVFESVPFVFLRTDWSIKFGDVDFYTDFPSLSPELCDWLVGFSNLRVLGLETPSLVSFPNDSPDDSEDASTTRSPFDAELAELLTSREKPWSSVAPLFKERDSQPLDERELCADAECHRILLGRTPPVLIVEGLVNLDALPCYYVKNAPNQRVSLDPERTFDVACLPLPIVGVDGCTVRVVASIS